MAGVRPSDTAVIGFMRLENPSTWNNAVKKPLESGNILLSTSED
jgi:hypothetical protein